MSARAPDPLDRLSRAVDLFMQRAASPTAQTEADFLTEHEDLRDLLEMLLTRDEAPDADAATADRRLGNYRLIKEIGRGGMGVVYEAEQVNLGRRVALKTLPEGQPRAAPQIERFRREALAAARLRHPGIVPIYDVGSADGTHFFAMEFVEGRPFSDVLAEVRQGREASLGIRRGAGIATEVAELAAQVAEALHYAHEQGIVHRDVKPHNILIDTDGRPRLADFGLAKDRALASHSLSGELLGTPYYMSPEQAAGKSSAVDHRTDLFSLGVVIYEALAQQRPFDGESSQQVITALSTREPRRLRRVNPRIPRDLEVICHKALEKAPGDRYASAADLAADLRRFLRHEPIKARANSWLTRSIKLARRHRAAAVTIACGLFLLAGGYVYHVIDTGTRDTQSRRDAVHTLTDLATRLWEPLAPGQEARRRGQAETVARKAEEAFTRWPHDTTIQSVKGTTLNSAGEVFRRIGETARAHEVITNSVNTLKSLAEEHPDAKNVHYNLACALFTWSVTSQSLGKPEAAAHAQDESMELLSRIDMETTPEATRGKIHALRASVLTSRGTGLTRQNGSMPEAEAELRAALDYWKMVPDKLPQDEYPCRELPTLLKLCHVLLRTGRIRESISIGERMLERNDELLGDQRGGRDYRTYRASISSALGAACARLREDEDACAHFTNAIELRSGLVRDYPFDVYTRFTLAQDRLFLATAFPDSRLAEAEDQLETAKGSLAKLIAEHPLKPDYRAIAAEVAARSAQVSLQLRRSHEEIADKHEQAWSQHRALIAERPDWHRHKSSLAASLSDFSSWSLYLGNPETAREHLAEAIALQESAVAAQPGEPKYRRFLKVHYHLIMQALAKLRDHHELAIRATAHVRAFPGESSILRKSLEHLCSCVQMARTTTDLSSEERDRLITQYATEAVKLLEILTENGDLDPSSVESRRLDQLRETQPFHDFLALHKANR